MQSLRWKTHHWPQFMFNAGCVSGKVGKNILGQCELRTRCHSRTIPGPWSCHAPAMSLIELVVVMAIVAAAMSLLLVAVQGARERARLLTCSNNLRQIALAAQNHMSQHKHFPSNGWGYAWIGDTTRGVGPSQPGGWAFQILHALEIDLPESTTVQSRGTVCNQPISVFRCPSRSAGQLGPHSTKFLPFNAIIQGHVAKTDYAICEGDYITRTGKGPPTLEIGESPNYQWEDVRPATGISFQRSKVTPHMVSDGLSNTLLVGEKHVYAGDYNTANDLGYDQSLLSGVDLDIARWTVDTPIPDRSPVGIRAFGSAHQSGVNMSYCDGATNMVSYAVDPLVFRHLGNRKDGKSTQLLGIR